MKTAHEYVLIQLPERAAVELAPSWQGNRSILPAAACQYAPGTQRLCLVNPDDPAQVLLTRHLSPPLCIGLVPSAFVAAGAFGIQRITPHTGLRSHLFESFRKRDGSIS